jgi:hypothetical protein
VDGLMKLLPLQTASLNPCFSGCYTWIAQIMDRLCAAAS